MERLVFDPYKDMQLEGVVRLVIHDNESNKFIYIKTIPDKQLDIFELTNEYNKKNLKYKYQYKDELKKWRDSKDGYIRLVKKSISSNKSTGINAKTLLKILHFNNRSSINNSVLYNVNEDLVSYCMRHILIDTYKLLGVINIDNIRIIKEYLSKIPYLLLKRYPAIAYYHGLSHSLIYFLEYNLEFFIKDTASAEEVLEQSWDIYQYKNDDNMGFKTGFLVTRANILSAYNREESYKAYQMILRLNPSIVKSFLTIEAITTYYLNIEVESNNYQLEGYSYNNECTNKALNLCFSADGNYFKMYALSWLQNSQIFSDITFNYGLVVESKQEFNELVENYQDLLEKLTSFTGVDRVHNTRFFWIQSKVINKTVYACARFYLASHLLENYQGDVYVTDIDQYIKGDLNNYLEEIVKDFSKDIYINEMQGVYRYLPGRRYLAGNIFIRNTETGRKYVRTLVDYTSIGLNEEFSWMLDQSATRYAAEYIDVGNLKGFGVRPLQQYPSLKKILRKNIINAL